MQADIHRSCVDDLIRAGNDEFRDWCEPTHERFETGGDEELPITFAGINITEQNNILSMDQPFYVKLIEELDPSSSLADFRSMRMKLAWLANSGPDLLFEISELTQIVLERFNESARAHWKTLNAAI